MRLIRAFLRRSATERRLLAEAMLLLGRAALAIRGRPFPQVVGFGAIPLEARSDPDMPPLLVTRAVRAVAPRMPFRALCFEQGLAVQRMLRRRGHDARLHYGIALGGGISAHVWVTLDGVIVHGGGTAAAFREVGQWP